MSPNLSMACTFLRYRQNRYEVARLAVLRHPRR